MCYKNVGTGFFRLSQCTRLTERQTDRWTGRQMDISLMAMTALHKNLTEKQSDRYNKMLSYRRETALQGAL